MIPVGETSASKIYWHDAEQTTIIHLVTQSWDWETAYESIKMLNDAVLQQDNDVYTIHHLQGLSSLIPKGRNVLTHFRRLVQFDPPNERLVIIVAKSSIMTVFLKTVFDGATLSGIGSKYRFVGTLDEAFDIVRDQKLRNSLEGTGA
ncbi:MAG: hypothetical protein IT320_10720 [Anaerolineae bacterium]|nr:hypothetical protein [Anaerolineae bacterium]